MRLGQEREEDSERALLQLIGVLELAEGLDVAVERLELCTRGRCRQRYCGPFPVPALVIAGIRGWYRDEVQAWLQQSSCAGVRAERDVVVG
ncbi:hypothetical protein [Vallicoccus soli]|uniref:Uncharacterized protein n=1 Tax=Vallicoccus soli TaxID=2339232 RepID=A0A3A3YP86_9ACTN|nr:hypothetical protein [Vallicoccus soli]RJK92507.1 hypothetical protein D5H78_18695 [Vallicoccus soli]